MAGFYVVTDSSPPHQRSIINKEFLLAISINDGGIQVLESRYFDILLIGKQVMIAYTVQVVIFL